MHLLSSAPAIILQPGLALSGLFALIYLAVAVYAAAVPQGNRRWWALAGLLAVLVMAALLVESSLARMLLLDLAALSAAALVWIQPNPQARPAARTYLMTLVLSIACVTTGMAMAGMLTGESAAQPAGSAERLAAFLIILGFAIKLALVPFYFWLPGVAASSTPMTTALIVATLDMAEFGELLTLRHAAPWLFTGQYTIWLVLALLSMFGGALLALAQQDVKRMLAFSTIDDMGYLLLGVLIGSDVSLTGAFIGMASHALFKVLMFGAVGIAERSIGEPLSLNCRGLSARFPVSSAMFITGALGMLGIPPLMGFAGRFRLYLAGVQAGGPALGITMALATALALLYYVRVIHRVWLGSSPAGVPVTVSPIQPAERPVQPGQRFAAEPAAAAAALIVLALIALVLGFFPGLLQASLLQAVI